jgi:hypothetical protein
VPWGGHLLSVGGIQGQQFGYALPAQGTARPCLGPACLGWRASLGLRSRQAGPALQPPHPQGATPTGGRSTGW